MPTIVQAGDNSGEPYQVMPPLAADEYDALRASIAAGYDLAHPVVTDENGTVLDGHHRKQVCAELGITPPAVVLPGLTEAQKHDYAVRANLARRHLTSAQKRELIAAELDRDPGRSDREIGRLVGADHKTVGAVRNGEIPHASRVPTLPVGDVEYVRALHARRDRSNGEQVIARYVRDVYELPPITVARGRVLVDGFYRWQAYKRQGIAEIPVEDLGDLTDLEILGESVRRNSSHGLPRTDEDDEYAESLRQRVADAWPDELDDGGPFPFHPIAQQFMPLTDADMALCASMAESIRKIGLTMPITTYQGLILDGRLRYLACRAAGVEPEFSPLPAGEDPLDYCFSMNMLRVHYTEGQLAMIAADAEDMRDAALGGAP